MNNSLKSNSLNSLIPNCMIWNGRETVPTTFRQIIVWQCTRFREYIAEELEKKIENKFKSKMISTMVLVDYKYKTGKFNIIIDYFSEEMNEQLKELYFTGMVKMDVREETLFTKLEEIIEDIKEIIIKLIEKRIKTGKNKLSEEEIKKAYHEARTHKPYIYEMKNIN